MEREWLEEQLAEGKSLEAIGKLAGKDGSTVGYWVKKHGLRACNAAKYAGKGGIPRDVLKELVERGLPLREIADAVELSLATVRYWMRKYELRTRQAAWRDDPSLKPSYQTRECGRHGTVRFLKDSRGSYFCPRCRSEDVAQRRRRVKQILVEEAGGRCTVCGYDRYVGALQFHHLDPTDKAFALSQDGSTRSIARARREAAKCVLVCANCHAEIEGGIVAIPLTLHAGKLPA